MLVFSLQIRWLKYGDHEAAGTLGYGYSVVKVFHSDNCRSVTVYDPQESTSQSRESSGMTVLLQITHLYFLQSYIKDAPHPVYVLNIGTKHQS